MIEIFKSKERSNGVKDSNLFVKYEIVFPWSHSRQGCKPVKSSLDSIFSICFKLSRCSFYKGNYIISFKILFSLICNLFEHNRCFNNDFVFFSRMSQAVIFYFRKVGIWFRHLDSWESTLLWPVCAMIQHSVLSSVSQHFSLPCEFSPNRI